MTQCPKRRRPASIPTASGRRMDNPRLYLWIALALLAWLNLVQWNRDFGAGARPATAQTESPDTAASTPAAALPELPSAPTGDTSATTPSGPSVPSLPGSAPSPVQAPRVHVVTDVLDLEVSLQGGD